MPQTQNELLKAIYQNSLEQAKVIAQLQEDLSEVKTQVKYTNGKVANLSEWKIREDERRRVLAEAPPIVVSKETHTEVQQKTDPKAVAAGVAFILATIGQIYLAFSGGAG